MREGSYTVQYGGPGAAWKIIYLPKGYGTGLNAHVAWRRHERPDDFPLADGATCPPDVQAECDRLNQRPKIGRGFDAWRARR